MWSNKQLEVWGQRRHQYLADNTLVLNHKDIYQRRQQVRQGMLQVLNSFLDGMITLKEFNQIFQQKTHKEWDIFHVRGLSGGLFLNKLVKYVPEEDTFAHLLRMILRVPVDEQDGLRHMKAFTRFLEGIIASRQATRAQLQPARVPFFLSVWWHIQEVERWPIFYPSLRHVLLSEENIVNSVQDPVEAYFLFKAQFSALKQTLALSTWELEQLITWHNANSTSSEETRSSSSLSWETSFPVHRPKVVKGNHSSDRANLCVSARRRGNMVYKKGHVDLDQTHIQWLLAKIGLKVGCDVWVAVDDHEKMYHEETLGSLSLPSLPGSIDAAVQQSIQHIDILWLRKQEVIAAYEVAPTAKDISRCLLQLSDLAVLFPKREVQFCVVTPQKCFEQVQCELTHPIFQRYDLQKRSRAIIQEHLIQHAEHILRWANSPAVVRDLTMYLSASGE
jgi:hypothetical protein